MSAPFFSVITVSYNAENAVEATINSALNQSFRDFEIIVKDGASKDNTLKMIPEDKRIKVFSEEDCGIYDAMNRAVELSSGEYLIFMNCGDLFASERVLEDVYKVADSGADIIYGDYVAKGNLRKQTSGITDFYLYRTPLCHQSMIIKRELFKKLGLYNSKYRILADYDFTLKAKMSGAKFKYIDRVICKYLGTGVSETKKGAHIKENERKAILRNYYSNFERFKYDIILLFSLRKFRIWLISGHSPRWFKVIYFKITNALTNKR